jgi:hypothetical protein
MSEHTAGPIAYRTGSPFRLSSAQQPVTKVREEAGGCLESVVRNSNGSQIETMIAVGQVCPGYTGRGSVGLEPLDEIRISVQEAARAARHSCGTRSFYNTAVSIDQGNASLNMAKRHKAERFEGIIFLASALCLVFSYGVAVGTYHLFPYRVFELAYKGLLEIGASQGIAWYYTRVEDRDTRPKRMSDQVCEGLNLVTKLKSERRQQVELTDLKGRTLHEWPIDWFKIWPDAEHIPAWRMPKTKPGALIHGTHLMENGDLVFNFEFRGMVCLDSDGNILWRLPLLTHHSIHPGEDGNLWVCGRRAHVEPDPRFPNREPPFEEDTILEVSRDGAIVAEWSVEELLETNGLAGLRHLGTLENWSTQVAGDTLHLNDVEPFPETIEEGFFKRGDILVSLRNINTVFVFNRKDEKIKFVSTGRFVRQHDPDFMDGNRFSVFDNNNSAPRGHGRQSRIVIISAPDNTVEVFFEGNERVPFYTAIMGKHQWLPNGNLLITESVEGRAFEINRKGELVWEYVNHVDPGVVGLLSEVQRLPPEIGQIFGHPVASESEDNRSHRQPGFLARSNNGG